MYQIDVSTSFSIYVIHLIFILNEPEIVVCDPRTCSLFNQQCVIASNLEALPDITIAIILHIITPQERESAQNGTWSPKEIILCNRNQIMKEEVN